MTSPENYMRALYQKLEALAQGGQSMTLHMLDGFVFGLLARPQGMPAVSTWFTYVYSHPGSPRGYFPFNGIDEMEELLQLVLCHYNAVADSIDGPNYLYNPMNRILDEGVIDWREWASGFGCAVALNPKSWEPCCNGGSEDVSRAFAYLVHLVDLAADTIDIFDESMTHLHKDAWRFIPVCARTLVDNTGSRFAANDERPFESTRRIKRQKSESIREAVAKRLVVS
ncbi:UPF0149 family protein [Antarcticirhabdus aurantiaca]|uniref:UPF0149 family protein n=1 Tax=Antarcticirhabdus aurantiaca TaxID=2606717 RepID=A0ACD4NIS4_9HYPH|nr:UPF0149 family protein [Jeongeuplla avenae]